ncbi:methyltransferase [candidate division KSB1 bacterium]|nr:methyltransferase [candidate division KSB1 bacterium]
MSIGAGGVVNNLLNKYQEKNGFIINSFDIDEKRTPDIKGDICTHDFDVSKYDVIVMAEVLEHLHTPQLAIDNVYKILRPQGKLIITVPFIMPIHDRPYDYFRYTRYGLQHLLKKFEKITIKERNSWGEAINVLFVRHIMNKNLSSRLAAPFFIIMAFINLPFMLLLSRIIKSDFITSGYLVTAVKRVV